MDAWESDGVCMEVQPGKPGDRCRATELEEAAAWAARALPPLSGLRSTARFRSLVDGWSTPSSDAVGGWAAAWEAAARRWALLFPPVALRRVSWSEERKNLKDLTGGDGGGGGCWGLAESGILGATAAAAIGWGWSEKSIEQNECWPWPRYVLACLDSTPSPALASAGAAATDGPGNRIRGSGWQMPLWPRASAHDDSDGLSTMQMRRHRPRRPRPHDPLRPLPCLVSLRLRRLIRIRR